MMAQQDPFAAVRLKQSTQQPQQLQIQPKPIVGQNDPFAEVRIKKTEGFPALYETGRHAARIGSRIAETIGGIPGDVSSLIESGVLSGLETLTGHKLSPEAREKVSEKTGRSPTSAELKKFSQKATKGLTSPQNEYEKLGDEYVETLASLLGPMKFRKALGVALGGTAAKKGSEILGLGEGLQEASKLGTMFMMTMINPRAAMKYASSQYEKANSLSKGAFVNAEPFKEKVQELVGELKKGVTTPAKNAVMKPAEELIAKVQPNGEILVHDLTAAKRDLNTLMKDPALLQRERKLLKTLGRDVDIAIKPYEKINPEFSKAYRPANEIYGAVMQGTKAKDFVNKILGPKSVFAASIGEALLGHPELILPTLGTTGIAHGIARSADFMQRIMKSPELRKFYLKAAKAAATENAPAFRLYNSKLEEALTD